MIAAVGSSEQGFDLRQVIPVHRFGRIAKYQTAISAGRVFELLDSERIRVDYDYQRGIKVTLGSDGSEKRTPMVDGARVEEIARKMLEDELHGGALTWNLRTNEVEIEYDESRQVLHIKGGVPTIPDSNHRHQAIRKAVQLTNERGLPFDVDGYEFPLVIEALDMPGEAALFHEYNQLGKPANPTRNRVINQAAIHNRMASSVMENSVLNGNIELVTNNLTRNTNKVMTFNTLAKGIEMGFQTLDEVNFEDTRDFLVEFVNKLAAVRPEIDYLPISERLKIRETTIGDSGLVFLTYFRLAGDLLNIPDWSERLELLASPYIARDEDGRVKYEGDLMNRQNPLWQQSVLVARDKGKVSIANRWDSREYAYRELRRVVGLEE